MKKLLCISLLSIALLGCDDDDSNNSTLPVCGDNHCDAPAENQENCPADCATEVDCGDGTCTAGVEDAESCYEDCGSCGDGVCTAGVETHSTCPEDCDPVCGDGLCEGGETHGTCPADCPPMDPRGIYQIFDDYLLDSQDLDSTELTFTRDGTGYQLVHAVYTTFFVTPGSSTGPDRFAQMDDGIWVSQLGFTFPFYNSLYTEITIDSNGFIKFDGASSNASMESVEELFEKDRIMFGWNDLVYITQGDEVIVDHGVESATSRSFAAITFSGQTFISWDEMRCQVVLFDDGEIRFIYNDMALMQDDYTTPTVVGIVTPGDTTTYPGETDLYPPNCGDTYCEFSEDATSCPADCT